jgi:hypothetical protein
MRQRRYLRRRRAPRRGPSRGSEPQIEGSV